MKLQIVFFSNTTRYTPTLVWEWKKQGMLFQIPVKLTKRQKNALACLCHEYFGSRAHDRNERIKIPENSILRQVKEPI